MHIGELARLAGVTVKAVRYYEQLGLITPVRESNGYRSFTDDHVRAVIEIRELGEIGISPLKAAPFLECLDLGHERGDECVSSLAVYQDTVAELDHMISALSVRRAALQHRLEHSAGRSFSEVPEAPAVLEVAAAPAPADYTALPEGLPVPADDGAASHLTGMALPALTLPTSGGEAVELAGLGAGRSVIYLYPLTGKPGVDLPEGWNAIPGARGCSTEACDFRDHFTLLRDAGVEHVFGLSSQTPQYQAEVVARLRLPFAMISDEEFALGAALKLPTFAAPGHDRLYARLTLVVTGGVIEHVFYPIFPPNTHAQQVLAWLEAHPLTEQDPQ
ncbi:peroxiredoxin/DNA-binding transcriptional MerR regulator [Leucobacter exalbidus]|uniref:Peroxiredoxin/DNA-binding transcriptional MerR regulator n=1 Tax=Leucobacter exalbidus TaxID=662960 RepID=A0A940PMR6_9MICO|nr:MerR family DNA-binding transcriptional regulator [Leucobacter exalbidus]MBP1326812.1 peroxiredoxin/DNA-binding transcriptional MerR regulator [Leucobacter exalbidus]